MTDQVRKESPSWAGDNPYIRLYHDSGDLASVASFFRIQHSPQGTGHVLFLADRVDQADSGDAVRACLTDNVDLANWLKDNFVGQFTGFRDLPEGVLDIHEADFVTTDRSPQSRIETAKGNGFDVTLSWLDLDDPFYVEFQHPRLPYVLVSLFVPAGRTAVEVNGSHFVGDRALEDFQGRRVSSACLALAETWLSAERTA